MGGAVAALAIGDDLLVGRDPGLFVHRAQFVRGLEGAVWPQVTGPFNVNRAGNAPAAFGAHGRAVVFPVAPRVEKYGVRAAQPLVDVAPGRDGVGLRRAGPRTLRRRGGLACDGQTRGQPRVKAAVQHLHVRMAEVLEEPECACSPDPRLVVIDNDRRSACDAAQIEQVIDHPHERLQGRGIGVDERDAPQVQVHGAGNVAVREILRAAEGR